MTDYQKSILAIRAAARIRGVTPWGLHKSSGLGVRTCQVLLRGLDFDKVAHRSVVIAAETLGIEIGVRDHLASEVRYEAPEDDPGFRIAPPNARIVADERSIRDPNG